jgi:acyl-CoA thioesterase YciA
MNIDERARDGLDPIHLDGERDGMKEYRLSVRVVTLPKDTNALGSIFGGYILSHIDQAAAEHARVVAPARYVTKVIREVNFIAPVKLGESVSFYTKTIKIGRTSHVVEVVVHAMSHGVAEAVRVTTAEVVMVSIDDQGNPRPITSTPSASV